MKKKIVNQAKPKILPAQPNFKKIILSGICVFLAAFFCYFKTLNFELTDLDDNNFINTCAPAYDKGSIFINAFKTNCMYNMYNTAYYRPVLALSFAISHQIAGQSEKFAHFVNILLHCICAVFVFIFLRRYMFGTKISFFAAIFFAMHPITIYTAAWIPGRNDSLFLINFLAALIFFIEYAKKHHFYLFAVSAVFTVICFFTKESGIIIPFIFAFYCFANAADLKKTLNPRVLALWALLIVFFIFMRKSAVSGNSFSPGMINLSSDNIAMFFDYYASLIFLRTPFGLNVTLGVYLLGAAAFLITIFFAFYKKDKIQRIRNSFFLALPLIFTGTNIVSERLWFQGNRMYLPLFAVTVLLFSFLEPYLENKKNKTAAIMTAVLIILSSVITFKSSGAFKNSLNFWNAVITDSRYENITARKFRVTALIKNGMIQDAVDEAGLISRMTNFSNAEITYALANSLLLNRDYENAAKFYELLISHGQMLYPVVFAGAFISFYYLGNEEKAVHYFNELMRLNGFSREQTNEYINGYNAYLEQLRQGKPGK
ncbi:MAG: glycosyltransferase family 39 protein [Endomicrobia bacterium]|nr:glycosyltransferase family 39 protein [Endomicrobiia bacterium]